MIFILGTLNSCSKKDSKVKCIQFVHIGTSDKLNFSSVVSINRDWCEIDVKDPLDSISIKRKIIDEKAISKIEEFFRNSELPEKVPDGPFSGYEVTISYDEKESTKLFILSQDESDGLFSELVEYLKEEKAPDNVIEFIEGIKERGYFFYG